MAKIIDFRTGEAIEPTSSSSTSEQKEEFKKVINQAEAGNNRKRVAVDKYPSYVCPKCGNDLWVQAMVVKKIPAIEFGQISNEDVPMPLAQMPILVCSKCGEIAPFIKEDKELMKALDNIRSIKENNKIDKIE